MASSRNCLRLTWAVVTLCVLFHPATAQERSSSGVVTVFDHQMLDVSFANALSNDGRNLLWSHTSGKGTYNVLVHSREPVEAECAPQGCSHKDYTAVVYVVSGSATLVVGGKGKATAPPDNFGGTSIQGGESHRIGRGDLFIMPPDTVHWYKDIKAPFQYIEVPVP